MAESEAADNNICHIRNVTKWEMLILFRDSMQMKRKNKKE